MSSSQSSCVIYAYILIRIWRAKSSEFRSAFYKFSIATGIAAITNVMLNWAMRMVDVRFQVFPNRAIFCNLDSWLSHICALAVNIGKTLSVSTRYTAICLINRRDFWDGRKVRICLSLMIVLPFIAFVFFPFFPAAFGIAKSIGILSYIIFLMASIPMCVRAVYRLRSQRIADGDMRNASQASLKTRRNERVLGFYAVVLTISHMFKTIQQCVWYIALIMGLKELQAGAISVYLIANTISTFAEPILLLVTSSKLRNEVFPWRSNETRTPVPTVSTIAPSTSVPKPSSVSITVQGPV